METDVKKFDTKVQRLKYKVLREVARSAWKGTLAEDAIGIPKIIVPGKIPTMRCCVYKERAILAERVKIAMGGDKDNPNVIETIDIACDECPVNGARAGAVSLTVVKTLAVSERFRSTKTTSLISTSRNVRSAEHARKSARTAR